MNEHPIIFSGPMVRPILEGRKIQTRRVIRPQPLDSCDVLMAHPDGTWFARGGGIYRCPYGQAGDRLWVREAHVIDQYPNGQRRAIFKDGSEKFESGGRYIQEFCRTEGLKWRPSIHMPRWASRLTLEITKVRVERLQEITEDDALAEGVSGDEHPWADQPLPSMCFEAVWDTLHPKKDRWQDNPWVWVLEFKKVVE